MKTRLSLLTGVGLLVLLLLTFWLLLGSVAAPAGAAAGAALLDSCNWTGTSSTQWSDGNNWSCSRAPTSDDDVTIGSALFQPFLNAAATVATLKMDGGWLTIGGSGSLTVTGAAEVSSNSHISNDGLYSAASTTVQLGAELIAGGLGTFDGPFTVQWLATLKPAAGTVLNLLGDLSNYGTLRPLANGSFIFQGQHLVNDGQAENSNLLVEGSGSHSLSGSGTWRGTGRLRVNATTLELASDLTYEATLLDLSAGGRLDLGAHTLDLPDSGTLLSLPLGTVIAGSGQIAASGGGRINNDGVITPTLHVLGQGVSAGGFGPFAGPLVVDAGATLTVTQYSNVLATGDVTITGTLGPGSYLLFGGRTLTNNGAIKVSTVQFQGGAQELKGTGYFTSTTMVRVMAGTTMTLASDHQLGSLQITPSGAADITGRTLSLSAAGNALQRTGTLTMTNSTVVYDGTAAQTVGVYGNLYHNLTIANAAGASAGTPAYPLSSSGLVRVQTGTFTSPSCNCNDVQIDAGGRLALFSEAAYRLAGDWTNNGTYAPAAGDTVTFGGPGSQSIGGSSVTLFGALVISNTAGVQLNASAGVTRTLTLKGDLTATGSNRLALDAGATTAGTGDVWGPVDRRGPLTAQHAYSFGNPDNLVTFANAGTLPSSFSVTLANTRPAGLFGALPRKIGLAFTDGSVYSATLRLHYRDSDLAGLSEASIGMWRLVGSVWQVQSTSAASAAENWIESAGVTGPGDWGLAAPGPVNLDVTLWNNPTTAAERAPYENIMRYFADGLYEAANGAHKLGTVTFHPSGTDSNTADIVWVERCHPSASTAGFGTDGLHINMCGIFTDGNGAGNDYDFLSDEAHQRGGGYTLAHEWGHYYDGLYDEYVGAQSYDGIFHFPHSTDQAVTKSIMNSQWNAQGGDYNWLNFSVAKNDTQKTAQYRVYAACGWDTLVRPQSDDPRDGERAALPARLYHSELVDVAPAAGQDSPLELPGSARSELSFVWEASAKRLMGPRSSSGIPYTAALISILGQNLSYPDPIVLLAFAHTDLAITDVGVQASALLPDGTTAPVAFADDGIAPDALAGDGLYSALVGYDANGVYTFGVQFDNNAGLAKFVSTAFQPSIGANGQAVPVADPILVGESFAVSKTIQVLVSNVAADDHGNTPAEATAITADNTPHNGRIDHAQDRDVFQFATLESGYTYVRVTNLALGMQPHLRVLGSDQTTVLFDLTRDPAHEGYLFTPLLGVPPGTTVYAEVSDADSGAAGGLYEFSAGAKLASDVRHYDIYLPYVAR